MVLLLTRFIWYWLQMKVVCFHKVQWLHFIGVVDKFVIFWCEVSSGFSLPKITKIG